MVELSPNYVILTGICGGISGASGNYILGDVVLADSVVYYEPGKVHQTAPQQRPIELNRSDDGALLEAALDQSREGWDCLNMVHVPRPGDTDERVRPTVKTGVVCSGEKVIADADFADQLRQRHEEAVSIEMEAAGIAYACQHAPAKPGFLMIKAVSDFADAQKGDDFRTYACATAAAFTAWFIRNGRFPNPGTRAPRKLVLGDLLHLIDHAKTEIVLPSYPNPRHPNSTWNNYPFNEYESAFDDVYCALRLVSYLESWCGTQKVFFSFDLQPFAGTAENTIHIGSSVSNVFTRHLLSDTYYRFGTGQHDHAIVDRAGRVCFEAVDAERAGGARVLVKDYSLITVKRTNGRCTVVLAGCRAYGQVVLANFLTDPKQVEELYQLVVDSDFQCVLEVDIAGRIYNLKGIRALVVKKGDDWHPVDVERSVAAGI